jgi:hypothetical protein
MSDGPHRVTPHASSAHLNDADIERFRHRELSGAPLVAFADHTASCESCRARVEQAVGSARAEAIFESAVGLDDRHLSEDDLHAYVDGSIGSARRAEMESHIASCASCGHDIRDLQRFVRDTYPPRRTIGTSWYGGLAAAALLVAIALPWALRGVRASPLMVLNDGASTIRVDRSGGIGSFAALSDADAAQVREALLDHRLSVPPAITALARSPGQLRGPAVEAQFHTLSPLATAVLSDRPVFRWTPLGASTAYVVTLQDQTNGATISSRPVQGTEWTPVDRLARGTTYVWQVQASIDGQDVIAPAPPEPPATFVVLNAVEAERLARMPESHLVRAVLYANAGVLDDAEQELNQLQKQNPDSEPVQQLVVQLDRARSDARREP